jgi:hypothetical protein
MGYSRDVKLRAMVLYAGGDNFELIARTLTRELGRAIDPKTPQRWHAARVPGDWEEHRRKMEQSAAREALARLRRERKKMTSRHFDDLEALRGLVKHSLFEQRVQNGARVAIPRQALRVRDVRDGVRAYRDVVGMQRLILGLLSDPPGEGEPEAPLDGDGDVTTTN